MTQQNIHTPEELLHFQLRSALQMEQHSLDALDELHSAANDAKVKHLFSHHAEETQEQIGNLERVFGMFEWNDTTAPSPATTGITKQAASLLERTDPALHDQVTLMSAMGNEHFEISAYQGLILATEAMGATDAASLLKANLDQEVHTSEELHAALQGMLAA